MVDYDENELITAQKEFKEVCFNLEKLSQGENILRGEIKQLVTNSIDTKKSLDGYSDAVLKYNTCLLDMKILESSVLDLDKSISSLDKSIVEYHSSKLEEVNINLRNLWINTYKGDEIDYIEIQNVVGSYKIVMWKEGVQLDMRGRCSAGQKMIASLLIRLALADTFSNSNIFTLDEPTTNLDKNNVESLALTLGSLIRERKNIQLIIITHDEEFLSMMHNAGLDYYYKIEKIPNKGSVIKKVSIY